MNIYFIVAWIVSVVLSYFAIRYFYTQYYDSTDDIFLFIVLLLVCVVPILNLVIVAASIIIKIRFLLNGNNQKIAGCVDRILRGKTRLFKGEKKDD
jgi:ABC-type amino acid transport system permease subunit